MSLYQTCILNENFNEMCNTYMQEPPKGLKDFIFSYASNHEADDGSNAKFQRNGIKNTNMQSYDRWITYL